MSTNEFNFDGLIGPTHNYAGLSFGNVASAANQNRPSSPRGAALQGLSKMKFVHDLGIGQCILPPLRRPRFEFLRELGFTGTNKELIEKANKANPALLANIYSASNMWTANAATVSPSADCMDQRLHFTTANLSCTMHRAIEFGSTFRNLNAIFGDGSRFAVHPALPSQPVLSDEGAANHTRLCVEHSQRGVEIFVYGKDTLRKDASKPTLFPARQTRLASDSIARNHGLDPERTFFIQQNPKAIDAGIFHNDVISVGNENVLLCHELSFVDQANVLSSLSEKFKSEYDSSLFIIQFSSKELKIEDAVSSYLFNSQLVTRPDGNMTLICPTECERNEAARSCTQRMFAEDNPIDQVEFLDLHQSMNNGGGPACLRLRVAMTQEEQAIMHPGVVFSDQLYAKLCSWITENYRETLAPDDLRDPKLVDESLGAIEKLAGIVDLPVEVLMDH